MMTTKWTKQTRAPMAGLIVSSALLVLLLLVALARPAHAAGASWTTTGAMLTARVYHTATLLSNGMVLVAGGANSGGGNLASAEVYGAPCPIAYAQALAADPTTIVSCSFDALPDQGAVAVFSTPLAGSPTQGNNYLALSTGLTGSIPKPGTFASTNLQGGNVRGDTDYDVTIMRIGLNVPVGNDCMTFDFRFLSEEYPHFVGTKYNDAFIAELDTSDWTTSGSTISAPHNFAFDSGGHLISINTVLGLSATNGTGTAFDGGGSDSNGGATDLLHVRNPITPGSHNLFLSIFDQGDHIYDSAVFMDNLQFFNAHGTCPPGVTNRRVFLPMIVR